MTQADLAQALHVTSQAISKWERGIGFPDIGTLQPLSVALGISIDELMNAARHAPAEENKRTPPPFGYACIFIGLFCFSIAIILMLLQFHRLRSAIKKVQDIS